MKKFRPLHDRVVVKRIDADTKTKSGIIIPDSAQEKPSEGEVIAVGPGKVKKDGTRAAMQLKVGDKVLFTSWAGDEFKDRKAVEGEILVMHEGDVLCVIE